MPYTLLCYLYRAPGISKDSFREFYETHQIDKLKEVVGKEFPVTHTRRYINDGAVLVGNKDVVDYDCVTEMTFEDEAHFHRFGQVATEKMGKLREREDEFMDRDRMVVVVVGEVRQTGR